jgi:endonuclease/exonuclease/phosphatase family metal-dependent hydrolase
MRPSLTLVQLNIERDKHLEKVIDFLKSQRPEVFCLQELVQSNIPLLEQASGATCYFTPMHRRVMNGSKEVLGLGIFSTLPVLLSSAAYYNGSGLPDVLFDPATPQTKRQTEGYAVSWCDIQKDAASFRIATTHFTWTPNGQADSFQREDIQSLLRILKSEGEFVLCGDFNAPRGGEIFSVLAEQFRDNIPPEYTTSLDGSLHRAGPLEYMVDGIFSTPGYTVTNVVRIGGVSDHCAFTASVERAK